MYRPRSSLAFLTAALSVMALPAGASPIGFASDLDVVLVDGGSGFLSLGDHVFGQIDPGLPSDATAPPRTCGFGTITRGSAEASVAVNISECVAAVTSLSDDVTLSAEEASLIGAIGGPAVSAGDVFDIIDLEGDCALVAPCPSARFEAGLSFFMNPERYDLTPEEELVEDLVFDFREFDPDALVFTVFFALEEAASSAPGAEPEELFNGVGLVDCLALPSEPDAPNCAPGGGNGDGDGDGMAVIPLPASIWLLLGGLGLAAGLHRRMET